MMHSGSPGLVRRLFLPLLLLPLLAPRGRTGPGVIKFYEPSTGFRLTLDGGRARFELATAYPDFRFGGKIPGRVEGLGTRAGRDGIGAYRAVSFSWWEGTPRKGEIRLYQGRKVALFLEGWPAGAGRPGSAFPSFDLFPRPAHSFCYKDRVFSPPSFRLEETSSPWLLFDSKGRSFLVSPASCFMVSRMWGDGKSRIVSGLRPELGDIPPGYTHATLLAAGEGINRTWDLWGKALTDFQGKKRPGPYADAGLKYLGYWTDNGAAYYYNFDPEKGYEKTLLDVMDRFHKEGIPYRYLQLDSWFYPKTFTSAGGRKPKRPRPKNPKLPAGRWNRYGGMLLYQADPGVFPRGLGEFHEKLGLPLVTHDRWIDLESPYRKSYRISGVGAVDPAWWDHVIGNIASWGVVTYEQDWLNVIYGNSPEMHRTVWAGRAFMDQMARACEKRGLTMQYCMAQPRHFLQGSRYGNLTTIRVSGDRFEPRKWRHALFTSRLAWSVGIYPWVDVFRSDETGNLLLACLSAGMVGPGDEAGEENEENLSYAARPDGALVKPDEPLLPVDETWVNQAKGKNRPLVAATFTDFGAFKVYYIFVYNTSRKTAVVELPPPSLGIEGRCAIYRPFLDAWQVVGRGETWKARVEGKGRGTRSWGYFVVAPFLGDGFALLGDKCKFVSFGKKRIARVERKGDSLEVEVLFAEGEKEIVLRGVSFYDPSFQALEGRVKSLLWNEDEQQFLALVEAGPKGKAVVRFSLRK